MQDRPCDTRLLSHKHTCSFAHVARSLTSLLQPPSPYSHIPTSFRYSAFSLQTGKLISVRLHTQKNTFILHTFKVASPAITICKALLRKLARMKSIGLYSNYLKPTLMVYTALGQISDMQFNMLIFKKPT